MDIAEAVRGRENFTIYGETKIGLVRSLNEDAFAISEARDIMLVADGMGGYVGGEIASKTAVEAVLYYFNNYTYASTRQLEKVIQYANSCILSKIAIEPSLQGMGTTLSLLTLSEGNAFWGHVGDSRIYLFRDGDLTQITPDHTFVQELLDQGRITQAEAADHPDRHVLTRAVGVDQELEVAIGAFPVRENDRLLLCSDGLTSSLSEEIIVEALSDYRRSEKEIIRRLFDLVYEAGAKDNVTAILATL